MRWYTTVALCGLLLAAITYTKRPHSRPKAPATRYPATATSPNVIREAKKWTVLISNEGFGDVSRGTGVLLDPTHVLTCAHVVSDNNDKMLVYFYPGYVLAHGKVAYSDATDDLAIVEIDVPAYAGSYAMFTTMHYDGEPTVIIGNALGSLNWFVSYGIISGETKRDLLTDGPVYYGDSGGPWIDPDGKIIAISDWGIESNEGADSQIYGGVASHTVYDFLTAYKKTLGKKK